jgi:acetyl-CoA carboxylase, biotin carboxylase subunit
MKIKKILIANRGEIAVRIIRTCREMGIETVSVHSTADEDALHVKMADESVCIGPEKVQLSYLNKHALLSAVEISGADAIHPGYGFLSENAEFAGMCEKWGVTFIGPRAEVIELMGDKLRSKEIARKANVPILEPIKVSKIDSQEILNAVQKMGLPILIKASGGGGGRGMARVDQLDKVLSTIERLEQEALNNFGNSEVFIEKYVANPRHIEVQIIADKNGHILHLGERDCTIQRRFQKVIEESPSPCLTDKERDEICLSAVNLAKSVGYDSAGTVEFIFDQDERKFYFMEMNTRIQVEHPVTEQRVQCDLIRWQIESASGLSLKKKQEDIIFSGHSIECRINAEDPITYRPGPGLVQFYYRPAGPGVRVDDYIYSGYRVPPFYDSMVAKIIVTAENREQAIARMLRSLEETVIEGIPSNITLHQKILKDQRFIENNYSTHFLNIL